MGPGLGQRVVSVRGRENACREGDGGRRAAAVVAGSVQPLVVEGCRRCQRAQERGAAEDPLGVVGVQPDPFPVVGRQAAANLPYPCRHGDASEVVDQCGSTKGACLTLVETAELARKFRQPRDSGRVSEQERRHQVGEVPDGTQGLVDRAALQHALRSRLGIQDLRPDRALRVPGKDLPRAARKGLGDVRVESTPGPAPNHPDGEVVATEQVLERGVTRHLRDAHGEGNGVASRSSRKALPVPAVVEVHEHRSKVCRECEPPEQHLCHVAVRRRDVRERSHQSRHPACQSCRAHQRRVARGRQRASHAGRPAARAVEADRGGVRRQRVVVAEDTSRSQRRSRAADGEQQGDVEGLGCGLGVGAQTLSESAGDHCAVETMLERHSGGQVRREGESRNDLDRSDLVAAHEPVRARKVAER